MSELKRSRSKAIKKKGGVILTNVFKSRTTLKEQGMKPNEITKTARRKKNHAPESWASTKPSNSSGALNPNAAIIPPQSIQRATSTQLGFVPPAQQMQQQIQVDNNVQALNFQTAPLTHLGLAPQLQQMQQIQQQHMQPQQHQQQIQLQHMQQQQQQQQIQPQHIQQQQQQQQIQPQDMQQQQHQQQIQSQDMQQQQHQQQIQSQEVNNTNVQAFDFQTATQDQIHRGFVPPAVQLQYPLRHQAGNDMNTWHSGYSPYNHEVCILSTKVKKCYGCNQEFAAKYRHAPHNVVIKHKDRRIRGTGLDGTVLKYNADYTPTYYHSDKRHICRKNPYFDGNVVMDRNLSLTAEQQSVLISWGIYVTLI